MRDGEEDQSIETVKKELMLQVVNPVVARGRSHSSTRKVTPEYDVGKIVEKLLPNGDLYIGSFAGQTPHGSGKYLWKDGCMYEGEWRKGNAYGRGKFSWPSGASFEGEFRSGRMEGYGTFIGSDGDTYFGSWSGDRKHGYGQKLYANGDRYEGWWKKNLQEGKGRYLWRDGNEYIGEWKNGVLAGKGVLIWANGNRYEGNWECGFPKGNGVFTWPDGSSYVASWTAGGGGGAFYPPGGNFGVVDPCETKRLSSSGGETARLPRICIWESEGEAGDITCDIVDTVETEMLYGDGVSIRKGPCCFHSNEIKKPGKTVGKGHKNYDLMLNLQLGIRCSVGKHAQIQRDLKSSDFDPNEKFWTKFPSEGSKTTPPHQSFDFWWKDYCPMIFRRLRELFQVDTADYMLAICGNDALREFSSPGKSGSFFYITQDDRFMIKTVKKPEVKVLIKMLHSYYRHVCRYENTLVTRFFGVHCVKPIGGVKTRFIVMGNLFCSEYRIHRRFDLKGSSYGRTTDKPDSEIDETTTLKDLDLNFVFRLERNSYIELMKQIDRDCEFLEAEKIMDYSLLVGLHFRDETSCDKMGLSPFLLRAGGNDYDSYQNDKFLRGRRFLEAELQDRDRVLSGRKTLIRLGSNMPARAELMARRSDFDQYIPGKINHLTHCRSGETYEVVLYFGIIDILQDYDITKKLEHVYKSLHVDPSSISAVDPKLYSKRFRDFLGRIFVEDR